MLEVWITDLSNPLTCEQYHDLLTKIAFDKRERLERFRYFEDAERSLLGDILIRTLIAKYNFNDNKKIVFSTNKYGKPYLEGNPDMHFNVSHSGIKVACAICDVPIGIDIENVKPIDLTIAERCFTQAEYDFINNANNAEQKYHRFYSIWTKKEAYIKQRGIGLHIPFKSFDVLDPQNGIYYQSIHQNTDFICNICITKKEVVTTYYISAQELIFLFNSNSH